MNVKLRILIRAAAIRMKRSGLSLENVLAHWSRLTREEKEIIRTSFN